MEKIEINKQYNTMRFYIYKVEVGVLLNKDNSDFECYNNVYDKLNAYYDENVSFELDYNMALEYAKSYVDKGVNGTYAIISKIEFDSVYYKFDMEETMNMVHTILGGGYIDDYTDIFDRDNLYSTNNIVYSIYKTKNKENPYFLGKGNGELKEDFVGKEV